MGTHCMVSQLQSLAISDVDLNKGVDNKICKKIKSRVQKFVRALAVPIMSYATLPLKKMIFEVLEKGYLNTKWINLCLKIT